MTKLELEKQAAELAEELNKLGMELLQRDGRGVKLLTLQEVAVERLKAGDYSDIEIPEGEDPIGVKAVDNDQIGEV